MEKRPYDKLFASKELKKLIVQRLQENNISPYLLSQEAEINWKEFKSYYLNVTDPRDAHRKFNQEKLLKVCELLGIKVKLLLVVQDSFDPESLKQTISKHRGRKPIRGQEEDTLTGLTGVDF